MVHIHVPAIYNKKVSYFLKAKIEPQNLETKIFENAGISIHITWMRIRNPTNRIANAKPNIRALIYVVQTSDT